MAYAFNLYNQQSQMTQVMFVSNQQFRLDMGNTCFQSFSKVCKSKMQIQQ